MKNVLLNIINDFLDTPGEEEKEGWHIKDDLEADWTLDKLREAQAEYKRFEMVVNTKVQQLQEALLKEKKKADSEVDFFESKLREYFVANEGYAKETKTQKSYKLPSGTLKLRKAKIDYNYDKDKLLEYARENDMKDLIKVTESFKWADFKKQLVTDGQSILNKETGEVVETEGLELIEKPEQFKVEV